MTVSNDEWASTKNLVESRAKMRAAVSVPPRQPNTAYRPIGIGRLRTCRRFGYWDEQIGHLRDQSGHHFGTRRQNSSLQPRVGIENVDLRWRVQFSIGVGVEVGITPNWSIGFEYDHLFLGKHDMTFDQIVVLADLQAITSMKQNEDLFTVLANYRFGGTFVRY
jgi:opacity protein-like surface antigen